MNIKKIFSTRVYMILTTSVIFISSCSEKIADTAEIPDLSNPVIITYSEERESGVQKEWRSFSGKYNSSRYLVSVDFDPVLSYLSNATFESPYPEVFSEPFTEFRPDVMGEQILDFYREWQGLFGCPSANLVLDEFRPTANYQTIRVSFKQEKVSGRNREFENTPRIEFNVTRNGELINIFSNLLPDVNLKIPPSVDIEMIKAGLIGQEVEYYIPGRTVNYVLSENDTFTDRPGYEIVVNRSANEIMIYWAVCLETVIYDEIDWLFLLYCLPETGEIVHTSSRRLN
ncbi:hypothetical protein ACFL4T_08425 [candidate division KSB1 bacterium]